MRPDSRSRPGSALQRASLAAATCSLLLFACSCGEEREQPRNIVLVIVDTLRADHMSLYGYERPTTPFLEELAREMVTFDQARSAAPWTKPSVATILTGLDPRAHGVVLHTRVLHSEIETLAEALSAAGYQTAGVQSNVQLLDVFGFGQGFDSYEQAHVATHDTSTGPEINAAALRWCDETRKEERPFFLYVHHYEPHFNYLPVEGVDFTGGRSGRLTGEEGMDELQAHRAELRPEEVAFLVARYDAEIVYQDRLLRDLVEGLDARGLLEDSLLVITADHGEEFLEHGDLGHEFKTFEELVHVPLLIGRPGELRAGARIAEPVSLVDLPRTMLDLVGLEARAFPGESFASLLDGAIPDVHRPSFAHAEHVPNLREDKTPIARDMIFASGWKLVRDLDAGTRALYDLRSDPGELQDRSAELPERADALEAQLRAHAAAAAARGAGRAPEEIVLDPKTVELMRALGYTASDEDAHGGS